MLKNSSIATALLGISLIAAVVLAASVSGMVVDDYEEGQAGAQIELFGPGESVATYTTYAGDDGSFELDAAPGPYRVVVTLGELSYEEEVDIEDDGYLMLEVDW